MPMAAAIAGPLTAVANVPIWVKTGIANRVPSVLRMVPIKSEAKSPWAMADKASMP